MYADIEAWRFISLRIALMTVLYLENTNVMQAFPPKRLEVLKLLCAQAAITIEKAQMYRSMEEAKQAAEAATLMKSTCTSINQYINVSFGEYEPRNSNSFQCSHCM
jgi:hypothetical protein